MRKLIIAPMTAAVVLAGMAPAFADDTTSTVPTAPTGLLTCTLAYDGTINSNPNPLVPAVTTGPPLGRVTVDASGTINYSVYDANATVTYAFCVIF